MEGEGGRDRDEGRGREGEEGRGREGDPLCSCVEVEKVQTDMTMWRSTAYCK